MVIYILIFTPFFLFVFFSCVPFGLSRIFVFRLSVVTYITLLLYLLIVFFFYECIYIEFKLPWVVFGGYLLCWSFLFDSLTYVMMIVVYIVSYLVHLYSYAYMAHDPQYVRFSLLLSLFTFSMIFLISAANYLQLFLGWELVGISSYFLINFWFTRLSANRAAFKAMLVNRVGDLFLLCGIGLIYYVFKSLDFLVIGALCDTFYDFYLYFFGYYLRAMDIIGLFFIGAASAKSAQFGLHIWLPDAMEGPTPVSALIHAATMVTAGIFLLVRSSFLLEVCNDFIRVTLVLLGSLTAFIAGISALVQFDLKKIIAYSTCSQLGYMVVACGLSQYEMAIYHLVNHAFFKALLFLAAGLLIHRLSDEQDIRRMGGLLYTNSLCYIMFLIGSFSLLGFPFFAGYFSKELIILSALSGSNVFIYFFCSVLLLFAAFCTAFYSFRLIYFVFFSDVRGFFGMYLIRACNLSVDGFMLFPLSFLACLSIISGYILSDLFLGAGSSFWGLAIWHKNINSFDYEYMSIILKLLPFFCILGALLIFVFLYLNVYSCFSGFFYWNIWFIALIRSIFVLGVLLNFFFMLNFFRLNWSFDVIYNYIFVWPLYWCAYILYKIVERGFLEVLGPFGLYYFFNNKVGLFYNGMLQGFLLDYLLLLSIFLFALVFFFTFFQTFIFFFLFFLCICIGDESF